MRESHASLVAAAKDLLPLLDSSAAEHEERGRLTDDVIAALENMGALRMSAPCRLGGLGVSSRIMTDVVSTLAKGCPSTAWVVMILNSVGWLVSRMPAEMVAMMMAGGVAKTCGPHNGSGTLARTRDTYVVTGAWKYASGCRHADWTLVPVSDSDGVGRLVALRMSDVEIQKTWLVTGMKGTGSDTLKANGAKVAPEQIADAGRLCLEGAIEDVAPAEPVDNYLYPAMTRALTLGVLIGIAEALLECVAANAEQPIIYTCYGRKSTSQVFQAAIGEVASKLSASRAILHEMTAFVDDVAINYRNVSYHERAVVRARGAVMHELLSSSIDKMMSMSGSSAFFVSNKAQRYWRDFSVGARHVIFNQGVAFECMGRSLLGVEPNIVPIQMV